MLTNPSQKNVHNLEDNASGDIEKIVFKPFFETQ